MYVLKFRKFKAPKAHRFGPDYLSLSNDDVAHIIDIIQSDVEDSSAIEREEYKSDLENKFISIYFDPLVFGSEKEVACLLSPFFRVNKNSKDIDPALLDFETETEIITWAEISNLTGHTYQEIWKLLHQGTDAFRDEELFDVQEYNKFYDLLQKENIFVPYERKFHPLLVNSIKESFKENNVLRLITCEEMGEDVFIDKVDEVDSHDLVHTSSILSEDKSICYINRFEEYHFYLVATEEIIGRIIEKYGFEQISLIKVKDDLSERGLRKEFSKKEKLNNLLFLGAVIFFLVLVGISYYRGHS